MRLWQALRISMSKDRFVLECLPSPLLGSSVHVHVCKSCHLLPLVMMAPDLNEQGSGLARLRCEAEAGEPPRNFSAEAFKQIVESARPC